MYFIRPSPCQRFSHSYDNTHGHQANNHEVDDRHEFVPRAAVITDCPVVCCRAAPYARRSGQIAMVVPRTNTRPPIHIQKTKGLTKTLNVAALDGSKPAIMIYRSSNGLVRRATSVVG